MFLATPVAEDGSDIWFFEDADEGRPVCPFLSRHAVVT